MSPARWTQGSGWPRVVAIGGGHGCAAALRAIRRYAGQVTAVVSVADDGGSSGRLRELLDVVALGDLRKCLVALAAPGSVLARTFEHRFEDGELAGHALGNLVLAGLTAVTGSPVAGVDAAADLLGVEGRVLPATTEPVVLKAVAETGEVAGQVAVSRSGLHPAGVVGPSRRRGARAGRGGHRRGGPGGHRPGVALHERPGRRGLPGRWPTRCAGPGPSGSTSATCGPRSPRPKGSTCRPTSTALLEHGVAFDVALCDTSRGLALGDVARPVVDADLAGRNGLVHDPGKLATVLGRPAGMTGRAWTKEERRWRCE